MRGVVRGEVMSVGAETVEGILEREVDELHLTLAKHELQGLDVGSMAEIFAASEEEIRSEIESAEYQEVKKVVALELAKFSADTDLSWDGLELQALERLHRTVALSSDPEFHLKVAAIANKAVRRHRGGVEALNPAQAGVRVSLSLTERFVEKLQSSNSGASGAVQQTRITERKASVNIDKADDLRVSSQEVAAFLKPAKSALEKELDEELDGVKVAV